MNLSITVYTKIREIVQFFWRKLKLDSHLSATGRPLKLKPQDAIAAGILKQRQNTATKKAAYELLEPACSYKTFVVSLNRWARWAGVILALILKANREDAHAVKHIDSTDIPVCLVKNAKHHQTMAGFANWGHSGKGWFYGLKLHLVSDLKRKILALKFTAGNTHDASLAVKLTKGLAGVFVADAAYAGEKLAREFFEEGRRMLFAKPRKNMRKMMTHWQDMLYRTRMLVELNFRSLKMFHGFVTSLPRSVNGYLAHYTYALLSLMLA